MKTDIQISVINRVKKARVENGMSQPAVSRQLGLSPGAIGNIESLKYSNKYSLKQLYILSKAFHVDISTFFFDKPDENISTSELIEKIIEYLEL